MSTKKPGKSELKKPLLGGEDEEVGIEMKVEPRRTAVRRDSILAETKSYELVGRFRAESVAIDREIAREQRKLSGKDKDKDKGKGDKSERPDAKKEIDLTEHLMTVEECVEAAQTDLDKGLTSAEAEQRLIKYGKNELTPPKVTPWWIILAHHLFANFSLLLWIGALLCFIAFAIQKDGSNLVLGITLVAVVVLTGLFSYYQEAKSASIMEGFKNFLPSITQVIRDGKAREVNSALVVPGDIIQIKLGDKLAADVRIIYSSGLKVDNSSLTGEPEPLLRTTTVGDANPLEAHNIAFFGTMAVEGRATGLVIRTGDRTVIGTIAQLAASAPEKPTPLSLEIKHFIKIITGIAVFLGVAFVIIGFAVGYKAIDNLVFGIGIIVANVPEGLLATVTVALTLTAKIMATRSVLVKHLESVETLGSTSVIASDKTGTLTQNRMSVAHLWYDMRVHLATEQLDHGAMFEKQHPTFQMLERVGVLCNKAVFLRDDENMDLPIAQRKVDGDAGETAFLKFFETVNSTETMRHRNPELVAIPFNSANKFQLSIHCQDQDYNKPRLLCMKGAPERIIVRCSHFMIDGDVFPITDHQKEQFNSALLQLMSNGERVLAVAYRELPTEEFPKGFAFNTETDDINFPMSDLTFVGLVSLIDPPRPAVPGAVRLCQSAGIKVIMVTGDHPETALAIAKMVNIVTGKTRRDVANERGVEESAVPPFDPEICARVVSGQELAEMSDTELDEVLDFKQIVFARTSPQQKLIIVDGIQRKTHICRIYDEHNRMIVDAPPQSVKSIVAVTGDGVNDSPALKQADIGVAMGIAGSDVAKEAASMILLNDDFSSIVQGVEEGRKIFDNLKKSIAYTLTSNVPEIMPFLLFVALRIPVALPTILILCIDLGTDLLPAIALAYEVKEADIMSKPPRDAQKDRLVTKQLIVFAYGQIGIYQALAGFFVFFWTLSDYGFPTSMLFGVGDAFKDGRAVMVNGTEANPQYHFVHAEKGWDFPLKNCVLTPSTACHNPGEALAYAQTAYFVSIIVCQVFTGLACKTRLLSLFKHGFSNQWLNLGILFEITLTFALLYIPGAEKLGTRPLMAQQWAYTLPWALFILAYDELRKLMLRNISKESLLFRMFYY